MDMSSALGGIGGMMGGGGGMSGFSGLQLVQDGFESAVNQINQQHTITSQVSDMCRATVPNVQQAWVGGDADAFANDVLTVLLPAIADLMAAIAGINTNLSSANGIINQADQKANGMVGNLSGQFGGILGGGGGGGMGGGLGGMLGGMGGGLGGGLNFG